MLRLSSWILLRSTRPLARTMPQQKLSAFFSTSKTPPKPSPVRTAAAVIIEEDVDDVEEAVVEVKRVRISSDVREVSASPPSSPPSSPVNQSKRRRVQILESDEESENEENLEPAEKATPKRNTAKLSKAFRSKIANRVQTPFVKKDAEEEVKPSPIASRLASFAFKKSNSAKNEEKDEEKDEEKEKEEKDEGEMEVVEDKSAKSEPESPPKSPKSPSPEKKTPVSNKKSKPEKKLKAEKKTPKSAKKTTQSAKKTPQSSKKIPEVSKKTSEPSKKTVSLVSAGSAKNYSPGKSNYSPLSDASWAKGQDVPYCALTDTLTAIEEVSGRLEKTMILSNFLRSVAILTPDDLHLCIYLCTNQVAPAYKGIELGVGETVVMRAIQEACGVNVATQKKMIVEMQDLGRVAEASRSKQKLMFKPKPLTVKTVFNTLLDITAISGNQGQAQKIGLIKKLIVSCTGSEARFIPRSLLGKLRCGLAEQTVLVAVGHATIQTPPGGDEEQAISKSKMDTAKADAAEVVKTCFCECPNFEHIVGVIKEHGVMDAHEHCKLTPGIPVKPMLAHPTKGVSEVLSRFEGGDFTCEYKYDGERAQIQRASTGDMSIFSRNQENNTSKYPDIIGRMSNCMADTTESFILDCEVVAWDVEKELILPFQILTTRKRKDADVNEIKVKVCLFAFDILYLNGESLVRRPLRERRELLLSAFKEVKGEFLFATGKDCSDPEEIQEFLEESIKRQCEGLMVKSLDKDATYEIAKRSHNWLKVKKDYLEGVGDSLDLVVIGAFSGKGKRSGVYGGYLLACYDPDTEQYQAICKIGTGFSDEDLSSHHKTLSEHKIDTPKSYYSYPDSSAPDVWFEPTVVWEVKCADLSISPVYTAAAGIVDSTKGISLRFPRFIRVREDKGAEDATSAEQVADLYNKQDNKQEGRGERF